MERSIRHFFLFLLFCIFITGLSCINWSNPYEDISKAKVAFAENSLQDSDTVVVDSVYSFIFEIYLEYYIDSFTITISKNAKWNDTTVRIDDLEENPLKIDNVYYETGRIEITITTYYTDNRTSIQNIYVYGISLNAPEITIMSGTIVTDTIVTSTIPFILKVKVEDISNELTTVHINDEEFDSVYKKSNYLYYCYETFRKQNFENAPIQARIHAKNIIQESITETYWICSTSIVDTSLKIVRIQPPDSEDTVTIYEDSILINGRIDGITNDATFYYLFKKSNGTMSDTMDIITKSSNTWQRESKCSEVWNEIVFYLFNTPDIESIPLDSNVLLVNSIDTTSFKPTSELVQGGGSLSVSRH